MNTKTFFLSIVLFAAFLSIAPQNAFAQGPKGKSFGFGLQVGEPTAITFRIWTSRANSWDAAIGSSRFGRPHLQAGYLWHFNDAFNSRIASLYAGVGGIMGLYDYDHTGWIVKSRGKWYHDDDDPTGFLLAARGAFGLQIIPNNTPIDIFAEIDPVLVLTPGTGFDFQFGVGIRFYP